MKKTPSRPTKNARRREEQRRRVEEQQRTARKKSVLTWSMLLVGGLLGVLLIWALLVRSQQGAQAAYAAVNAISCDRMEQSRMHVHAHLSMYIEGKPVPLPANISIAPDGSCMYWLHTHASNGIIHVEAPVERAYTFGDLLTIWQEQFQELGYPAELAQPKEWQIYVNGELVSTDMRALPLSNRSLITLAYKSPGIQPDTSYNWNGL